MGKYRSDDSDDDYRKAKKKKKSFRRARSRSRSSSDSESSRYSSSKTKKSRKKHKRSSRSRSRSTDRRRPGEGRTRRSRSRSTDRYASSRARSHSRSPSRRSRRRSRSPSGRRQISPAHSKSRRSRSRGRHSRSYSRDRRSRSRSAGRTGSRRSSPDRRRDTSHSTASPSNVALKGLSLSEQEGTAPTELLTPAEQAEQRMRLALKAAAAADEQLRMKNMKEDANSNSSLGTSSMGTSSLAVLEHQDFAGSVAAIESDSFVVSSFTSSRSKVKEEPSELRLSHDDAIFGSLAVTGFTLKPDPDTRPIDMDPDSIMHPSLYCDPDEKMDRWMQRLAQLRRRKLEGEAM